MEEIKVMELPEKSEVEITDQFIIEDEDGTKLGTISSLKKIMINNLIFNNVEEMKSASLKEGETCITLGYYTANDGGGAQYYIEYSPASVEDKANIHYLYTSDTLRAKIMTDGTITPEQFGAYGDGVRNDYNAITKCINSGYDIRFISNHKYRISTPLQLKSGLTLDFNGATIIPSYCDGLSKPYVESEEQISNVTIRNVNFDMTDGSTAINIQQPASNIKIYNVTITNEKLYGIRFGAIYSSSIDNISIIGGATSAVGIGVDGTLPNTGYDLKALSLNINNASFHSVYPGISVNCIGATLALSVTNCDVIGTDTANTFNAVIRLMGGTVKANINNINCHTLNTAFVVSTEAYLTISDVECNNIVSLLDDLSNAATITIGSNVSVFSATGPIVKRLYGTLINNSPYLHNPTSVAVTDTTFSNYSGTLYDTSDPRSYDIIRTTGSSATLRVDGINNKYYNIAGSVNITAIEGGIIGQRIILSSTANRSIRSSNLILLQSSSVSLTQYNTIELKKIAGGKWQQI